MVISEVRVIGQMDNTLDHTFESASRVYDRNGLCPTIPTCAGGGIQPKVIERTIVAMRGRGERNEQRLEPNGDGLANALTTVQKDNMVLEEKTELNENTFDELEKVRRSQEEVKYRIRKLTPRETWRLMGYTDEDFDKAASVNSNSQLYKEAGNAIVKQVLMAIFSQMNIRGVKPLNDGKMELRDALQRR